jgi:hypothetical protein
MRVLRIGLKKNLLINTGFPSGSVIRQFCTHLELEGGHQIPKSLKRGVTMKLVNKCAVSLLTALLALAPAFAQQSGLVNVNLTNVKTDIAKNINVNVSQIPVTIQVPVAVAANVCGVAVDVLTSEATIGDAKCDAKTTNDDLNKIVQTQLNQQKTP